MNTYKILGIVSIVALTLQAQNTKFDHKRIDNFRKHSGLEKFKSAQGVTANVSYANYGFSFQANQLESLKDFTIIDEQIKPVFAKGIVKTVTFKSKANSDDLLTLKMIAASENSSDLQDIIASEVINASSASDELLAEDYKQIDKGIGDFLLGNLSDDGKLLFNASVGKDNCGVLLTTSSKAIDLLPVCEEISSYLSKSSKGTISFRTQNSYAIPERLNQSKTTIIKRSAVTNNSQNAKTEFVSSSRKLKMNIVNNELVVSTGNKTGVDTVGIVTYDPQTLSSQWKTQLVDIQ